MREDTKNMMEACSKAKAIMNSYTLNRNFNYTNADAAIQGLRDRQNNALKTLLDARPEDVKLTKAAENAYDKAWLYVNKRFNELFRFVESKF